MLFTSHAIKTLTEDHIKLRKEIKILKNIDLPLSERRLSFSRLLPHLTSHTKREEKIIYSYMKLTDEDDLRIWALEGKEEHQLIDRLIQKMLWEDITGDEWTAKARVLAELIEHHIDEEDLEIFPSLNKELDKEIDDNFVSQFRALDDEKTQTNYIKNQNTTYLQP